MWTGLYGLLAVGPFPVDLLLELTHYPSYGRGKIFIGGLSWDTTTGTLPLRQLLCLTVLCTFQSDRFGVWSCVFTDNLTSHFKKYGEITDAVIMKDRNTGHPRGFGFVTFAEPSVCDTVVQDKHVIDGRTVSMPEIY